MVLKALFVHGCPSGHMLDCEEAIEFAKSKGVKYMIVTFPLAEANTAFEHMISGKVRFRSVPNHDVKEIRMQMRVILTRDKVFKLRFKRLAKKLSRTSCSKYS